VGPSTLTVDFQRWLDAAFLINISVISSAGQPESWVSPLLTLKWLLDTILQTPLWQSSL
jgi:hypothetical protein